MSILHLVKDNVLTIANREVSFQHTIRSVVEVNELLVILLAIPYTSSDLDNVYGVSDKGDVVWQIQNVADVYSVKNPMPYENISIVGDDVVVSDFYGRRYFVNSTDGKIVGRDLVR